MFDRKEYNKQYYEKNKDKFKQSLAKYKSHCIDCSKVVDRYTKRCNLCWGKSIRGENNPGWKGRLKPLCVDCGKIISFRRKRCNICRGRMASGKNHPSWKEKFYCVDCNKLIKRRKYKRCWLCYLKFVGRQGENNSNWRGGISREPYPFNFNKELKELIRKRDGHKCQKCQAPQVEFYKRLYIHHIDYDKKNLDPKNLITLCNRCNVKVNKNREKWAEFFEKKIKWIYSITNSKD